MNPKMAVLAALSAISFISGGLTPYIDILVRDSLSPAMNGVLIALAVGSVVATLALIVAWYHIDTSERGYRRTTWLNAGVIAMPVIAFPYYFLRSRGARGGFIAILLCALCLVGFIALSAVGERATAFALERSAAPATESEPVLVGTVENIVDGDTLDVLLDSGTIRVRMHGIDTPERGQPFYKEAKDALTDLVSGEAVQLQPIGQPSYDRMVARVYLGDLDVNAEQVKQGMAYAERRFLAQVADGEAYCVFEADARAAKRGFWALPWDDRIAPWEWRRRGEADEFTDYTEESSEGCIADIGLQ